jgi:hypothetical protein
MRQLPYPVIAFMSPKSLLLSFSFGVSTASAALSVSGPTTGWVAVPYANPALADPAADQQTGSAEGDIVGNAANPSFYTAFDNGGTPSLTDGEIGFRVRLGADSNPAGLKTVVWFGIDANMDGKIDLFAGTLENIKMGFYPAGTDLNISPSTTSIQSSNPYYETAATVSNFSFTAVDSTINPGVTNTNLDGGTGGASATDHFVTIALPFANLVAAVNSLNLAGVGNGFNENTPLRYLAATSQQANSLNQDINGIGATYDGASNWTQLGGLTNTMQATGVATIPEPAMSLLGCLGALGIMLRRRA